MKDHAMRHPLSYQFHCIVRARGPNGDSYAIGTWIVEQGQGRIDTDAGPIACASIRQATRALYAHLDPDHALKRVPRWTVQWQYSLTTVFVDIPGFVVRTIQHTPAPTPWMRWPSLHTVATELSQWLDHTQRNTRLTINRHSIEDAGYEGIYRNATIHHRRLGCHGIMADIHPGQASGRRTIMIDNPKYPGIVMNNAIKQHHTLIPTHLPPPYAITTRLFVPMTPHSALYLINQDTRTIIHKLPTGTSELHNWLNAHIPNPPAAWFSSNHARIAWMRYVDPQFHHIITHIMESILTLNRDIHQWNHAQHH